jgi:hypothetical protein
MTNLLNFNKKKFHSYIFNTSNLMAQIIQYMGNKSISEFIVKLLQINGLEGDEEESSRIDRLWKEFVGLIIERLINSRDDEESINGASIMCELTKDSTLYSYI